MLSPRPLVTVDAWENRGVLALDILLASIITAYAAYQLEAGSQADIFYAVGVIVGIILLRTRDMLVKRHLKRAR